METKEIQAILENTMKETLPTVVEATVEARGVSLDEMELSEMDQIWEEAKQLERKT